MQTQRKGTSWHCGALETQQQIQAWKQGILNCTEATELQTQQKEEHGTQLWVHGSFSKHLQDIHDFGAFCYSLFLHQVIKFCLIIPFSPELLHGYRRDRMKYIPPSFDPLIILCFSTFNDAKHLQLSLCFDSSVTEQRTGRNITYWNMVKLPWKVLQQLEVDLKYF